MRDDMEQVGRIELDKLGRAAKKAQNMQRVLDAIARHGEATMAQVERATGIAKATVWFLMTDLEAQKRIYIARWQDNSARYVVGEGVSVKRPVMPKRKSVVRLPKAEQARRDALATQHNELMGAFFGRNA